MKTGKEYPDQVVCPLPDSHLNRKGRVAYLHTKDRRLLRTLMAMGVLPGIAITLIQKFPSYVFQIGHSQFAVDRELASAIYVSFNKQEISGRSR